MTEKHDWYFTFCGDSQYAKNYVVINGTGDETSEEMFRRYGENWAMQYASAEGAGVARWGLTEIN